MSIFGFVLLFVLPSFPGFVMGAGLIEFGFGVEQSATSTWMCDCIESETRSAYSSIFSTIQSVAGYYYESFGSADRMERSQCGMVCGSSGDGSGYCDIGYF